MTGAHHLRLQKIFREVFDQATLRLTPDLSPATLPEWDSVAMVQIVLATESEFGVELSVGEVASLRTAGDLQAVLEAKLK